MELIECSDCHPGPDVIGYLELINSHLQEQEADFRIPEYFYPILCEAALASASPSAALSVLNYLKEANGQVDSTLITQVLELLRQYPETLAHVDLFYFWDNLSTSSVNSYILTLLVRRAPVPASSPFCIKSNLHPHSVYLPTKVRGTKSWSCWTGGSPSPL
jgi:hypothetical protein